MIGKKADESDITGNTRSFKHLPLKIRFWEFQYLVKSQKNIWFLFDCSFEQAQKNSSTRFDPKLIPGNILATD